MKSTGMWPLLGIREKSIRENYNKLLFEEPLLPVQKKEMVYGGYSMSTWLQVDQGAKVYMRDAAKKVPLLYTTDYQDGKLCLINGTFLADVRCLGLLTGAVGAVSEDFIYPVLGVKVSLSLSVWCVCVCVWFHKILWRCISVSLRLTWTT